jgi:two-component system, LytTR family, sensor kinase
MVNPVFSSRRSVAFYSLPWVIVIILHSFLLYYNFRLDLAYSIGDAVVFNVIFAIMGTGLWYVVQYNSPKEKGMLNLLINHAVVAIVFIFCWYAFSAFLLSFLHGPDQSYSDFLRATFTWRVTIGFIIYLVLLLAFFSFKFYDSLKEKELQQVQLQNYLREAELRSLKSQLNPHFIFNSLNSINALTVAAPEKAREMVVKLSEFLRYALKREGEMDMAKLSEELENARRYLDIEKVRFGKNLDYQEEITEDCLDILVPNYVLQPLLENAIKHGVYDSLEPVLVRLACKMNGQHLSLTLSNNFEKEKGKTRKGEGIGLKNIRNRLKLIYGKENLMSVKEQEGEFIVNISIPTTKP